MTEITVDDVRGVLSTDDSLTLAEITERLYEGEIRCSECGSSNLDFQKARDAVDEAMITLLNNSEVTSTPDWEYRLARRKND